MSLGLRQVPTLPSAVLYAMMVPGDAGLSHCDLELMAEFGEQDRRSTTAVAPIASISTCGCKNRVVCWALLAARQPAMIGANLLKGKLNHSMEHDSSSV